MPTDDRQKDYLSLKELIALIPYKAQTIYNWIHAGVWQSGVHYFKPTPRKLIFHYPTIKRRVEGQTIGKGHTSPRQRTARDAAL
jgi:hypothetical protein